MKSASHIRPTPFLKILPVVVAGIAAANAVNVPLWIVVPGTAVCMACAVIWLRKGGLSSLFAYAALLLFAASMTYLTRPQGIMPHGERVVMTMCVTDAPVPAGRWTKASARIDRYRPTEGEGGWLRANEKVVARFDTSFRVSAGDRLIATGYAGSLGNGDYAGYERLMNRRGYTANIWINPSQSVINLPRKSHSPKVVAARIKSAAAERLSRLRLTPEELATAAAMTIGDRDGMGRKMREEYSLSGAAHLLAVSGLHVGIVALLFNVILYFLPSFRYGHIVKNLVAVTAIWGYALLTGLSPSVVRAAMMLSGAQLALAASRTGNSANILLATACIMLLVNPDYLYDVSFQLSFTAVGGIFVLYRPMYRAVCSRFKLLNALWALFIVGLAATLSTAPLVSHYFGRIPLIGLAVNPVFILTANVTVLFSLIWIMIPAGFLNEIFSLIIGFSTTLQNSLTETCASKSWASVPVRMEMWQVMAVYAAAIALYVILQRRGCRKKAALISGTI